MVVALTLRPFFAFLWWVVSIMLFILLYLCKASHIPMNYFMTLLTSALGLAGLGTPEGELPVLTPEAFITAARADTTAVLLDVRRPSEYAEGHLEGAQLLDWLSPSTFIEGLKHLDKQRTYYVYCRSGKRSNAAATYMLGQGFRVRDMQGGYLRWTAEGRPVVK